MKALGSLSNLFGKRAPAAALAGVEGKKGALQRPGNTTIWAVVTSLLLAVAVGGGVWWWKAKQKAGVPVNVAHAPAKAIVNAPPAAPLAEQTPEPAAVAAEPAAVQPEGMLEASSAVAAAKPLAESASQENGGHGAEAAAPSPAPAAAATAGVAEKPKAIKETAPLVVAKKKTPVRAVKQQGTGHEESKTEAAASPSSDLAGSLEKRSKPVTAQQQADIEFRKGVSLMQQGHINDALAAYEAALKLDAGHEAARQAMVALLLEGRRMDDAERVLREGVKAIPQQSAFAMMLARIQVERGAPWSALLTLQGSLPYARERADYQAFMAALLQRLEHHKEAVAHYQAALQIAPNSGLWLMGMGLSLESLQRIDEARDAFRRALETRSLNTELQEFVTQRIKEL